MGVVTASNLVYLFTTTSTSVVDMNLDVSDTILSTALISNSGHLQLYILTNTIVLFSPILYCPFYLSTEQVSFRFLSCPAKKYGHSCTSECPTECAGAGECGGAFGMPLFST